MLHSYGGGSSNSDALVDTSTVVRNTGTPGQVGLDAQTAAILQLGYAYVQNSADTTKQNNFAVTSTTRVISWRGSAAGIFSGFAGGAPGRRLTVCNDTTDFPLIIEPNSGNSTDANQVKTRGGWPIILMPGDSAELLFSEWINRWIELNPTRNPMGLTKFEDFIGDTTGGFTSTVSGTSAAVSANTFGVDATEKAKGVVGLTTGTDTTGRASIGNVTPGGYAITTGCALGVLRVAVNTATDGTNTFAGYFGFFDTSGGTVTDGAGYEYRWSGSAAEWNHAVADATSVTRAASGVTVDNTYKIFVIFINADGTRVDFFRCEDSSSFTKDASVTTDLPEVADLVSFGASVIKSAGTTSRTMIVDYMGFRLDGQRG
jgi:hypothetical protein